MEGLRKSLGYIVFGFLLIACLLGVISKLTVDYSVLFNLRTVGAVFNFAATWLFELVFWFVAVIMCIVGLAKTHKYDGYTLENKIIKVLLMLDIAVVLVEGTLLAASYIPNIGLVYKFGASDWVVFIASIAFIVLDIVRFAGFAGKRPLAAKIMGSCLAIIMLVCAIFSITSPASGAPAMASVAWVLFIIAFVLAAIVPFLSTPLKAKAE